MESGCKGQKTQHPADTKNQLKTIQKIEHNLAYMDYAMIFFYSFIGD